MQIVATHEMKTEKEKGKIDFFIGIKYVTIHINAVMLAKMNVGRLIIIDLSKPTGLAKKIQAKIPIINSEIKKQTSQIRRCQKRVSVTGLILNSPTFVCYFLLFIVRANEVINEAMASRQNNSIKMIENTESSCIEVVTAILKITIEAIEIIEMYKYRRAICCLASANFSSDTFFNIFCFFFISAPTLNI